MRAFLILALSLGAPASLAAQDTSGTRAVEVQLSSFSFAPGTILLKAGVPVILHLANTGKGGHNFTAPKFFAAASGVSGPVRNGTVEVPSHKTIDVRLIPVVSSYEPRCSHFLHSGLGCESPNRRSLE